MILDRRAKRTAANAWIDSIDPLNGLSIAQSRAVFNAARRHGSPLLQKIYAEVEASDPVLMTCVERRASALACLGWRAVADASAPDPDAAERQRLALEAFADGIGNLDEAIEHLDLAFFRGFSVVQPVWDGGAVRGIALLDTWNFLFGGDGALLWNPECSPDPADCEEVGPEARVVALRRRRCIDWPALAAFLRKYVGERDWGRFIERYGVPPVDVVMGAGTTEEQRADYVDATDAAHDGRCVAWPPGTVVSRAEGARGQDPFTAFVEHQEKMIVLMATGGTLTSLAQADTGSLAGGAQMDVWEQIVSRDGVAIAGALNRDLFLPFLRARFPGERPMARIVLGREAEPTADEAAGLAGKLRGAGYLVDQSQLEEATGFRLEKDPSGGAGGPPGGGFGGLMNKAAPQTPLQTHAKALQSAPRGAGGEMPPPDPPARLDAILGDFSERLEEEMAEEMFAAAAAGLKDEGRSTEDEGGEEALNRADANGQEHGEPGSGKGGQFVSKGGGSGGSELVKRLTDGATPRSISEGDARAALKEGFSVGGPNGQVNFGEELLKHIDEHGAADAGNRLARLKFAIDTVSDPDTVETSHRGDPRVTRYFKAYDRFGMNVYTDKDGNGIEIAWDLIGKRKERK